MAVLYSLYGSGPSENQITAKAVADANGRLVDFVVYYLGVESTQDTLLRESNQKMRR